MSNSVHPDQTAPSMSSSALSAYAILVYKILEHLPYIMTHNLSRYLTLLVVLIRSASVLTNTTR